MVCEVVWRGTFTGVRGQAQSSVPSCGFLRLSGGTRPEVGLCPGREGATVGEGLTHMCRHVTRRSVNAVIHTHLLIRGGQFCLYICCGSGARRALARAPPRLTCACLSSPGSGAAQPLPRTPRGVAANTWTPLLPMIADSRLLELGLNYF